MCAFFMAARSSFVRTLGHLEAPRLLGDRLKSAAQYLYLARYGWMAPVAPARHAGRQASIDCCDMQATDTS